MKLHTLKPAEGSKKKNKRIGRGPGSTRGGTSTKGHKGQQSRSGYSQRPWFEGGQMPLYRRIPKFGFKNRFRVEYKAVNLDTLQELADKIPTTVIDHSYLANHGIISNTSKLVKVLGRGELKAKVDVKLNKASKSAIEAIEKAGGSFTEIDRVGNVVERTSEEAPAPKKEKKTVEAKEKPVAPKEEVKKEEPEAEKPKKTKAKAAKVEEEKPKEEKAEPKKEEKTETENTEESSDE